MTPWRWCGYAHHFIGGADCRFSLATFVADGRWLVSTVGDYRPDGGAPRSLGSVPSDLFETMVFECDPSVLTEDGEPSVLSWIEDWCARYATASEATEGHLQLCAEYERERGE